MENLNGHLVRVHWVDSTESSGWQREFKQSQTAIDSVGWVLIDSDEVLGITGTVASDSQFLGLLEIPWCAVEWYEMIDLQFPVIQRSDS